MKKFLVLLLALAVAVSIAACSKKNDKETTSLKNGEAVSMDFEEFTIDDGTTAKGDGKTDSDKTTKKGETTKKGKETTTKKSEATTKKDSTTKKGGGQTTVTATDKYETPIIPIG